GRMSPRFMASSATTATTPYLRTGSTPPLRAGASLPTVTTTFIYASFLPRYTNSVPPAPARLAGSGRRALGTVQQRHLQVQLDLLPHDPAARFQRLLPVEEPVQPADHRGRGQRRSLAARGV